MKKDGIKEIEIFEYNPNAGQSIIKNSDLIFCLDYNISKRVGEMGPYIENSPAKDRIKTFTRYISDAEVPLFFSAADITVLPYRTATQSGISAISFHFDVPLITTNVGGLKEAIEQPGTGIVVDKAQSDHIANGIKQFFEEGNQEYYINNIEK